MNLVKGASGMARGNHTPLAWVWKKLTDGLSGLTQGEGDFRYGATLAQRGLIEGSYLLKHDGILVSSGTFTISGGSYSRRIDKKYAEYGQDQGR
jgi:hypothetical protein